MESPKSIHNCSVQINRVARNHVEGQWRVVGFTQSAGTEVLIVNGAPRVAIFSGQHHHPGTPFCGFPGWNRLDDPSLHVFFHLCLHLLLLVLGDSSGGVAGMERKPDGCGEGGQTLQEVMTSLC